MDLFGSGDVPARGCPELNDMRRRFAFLEKKVECGDFNDLESEEFSVLKETLILRESEERKKWDKLFRK